MTVSASAQLNDVDIDAVGALVQSVQRDPANADTTWAAHVNWLGGFESEGRVRQFAPTPSDEPLGLGGRDSAANPAEQLLTALGNCLAVGYAAKATVVGIELKALRIDVKGDLDLHAFLGLREGHAGFSGITAEVHIESDAPRADLDALHSTVVGSSPIGHTINHAVPLTAVLA